MKPIVFALMGPTAIGKTDLACELSLEFPIEIINVDSSLMYKELNIGAAKPSPKILEAYPHHLVNCCDLSQVYSVAQFCEDAKHITQDIHARGRIPLFVGGTMMYFQVLQQGLSVLPETSSEIRKHLLEEAESQGWDFLHERLKQVDLESGRRIHPHDKQRILRGLEIFLVSGRPWSELIAQERPKPDYQWINMALMPEPRAWLHDRIHQRLEIMIQHGFLQEVEQILRLPNVNVDHPALKSVGYRQAIHYLMQGKIDKEWQQKILYATRQLAKRQLTWLRGFEPKNIFCCPDEQMKTKIIALMRKLLDNN